MGKLIVIEGVDSSGKETQTKLLYSYFQNQGMPVQMVSFPDYESNFCIPVKRYLAGDLGDNPDDVNAYAASSFYAIDRFASFKTKWGSFYKDGGTVVCDRYVTSNIVHQALKVKGDKRLFIDWLTDFEYNKLELPVPDAVLFLDMPPEYAQKLMEDRKNKITGQAEKDIHEKNAAYLQEAYDNAVQVADHLGWHRICCVRDGIIKGISEIHEEIVAFLKENLK